LSAKSDQSDEYLKYINQITDAFAKDMEKKYGLLCTGSGGSMPHDVEEIELSFVAYQKVTIEEVRRMEVDGIQNLLSRINAHEKIRPYLREYPFDSNRVGMSVAFYKANGERPHDGSIALAFLAKNKIFYEVAEMRKEMSFPSGDFRDENNPVYYPPKERIVERLETVFEEPFEDAVKIVGKIPPQKP
jgi:hypothetical protein